MFGYRVTDRIMSKCSISLIKEYDTKNKQDLQTFWFSRNIKLAVLHACGLQDSLRQNIPFIIYECTADYTNILSSFTQSNYGQNSTNKYVSLMQLNFVVIMSRNT